MLLGALIDAGVPLAELKRALGSLAIDGDAVWTERVNRAGIMATKFQVRGEGAPLEHAHAHDDDRAHTHAHHHAHEHVHAGASHSHSHAHDDAHAAGQSHTQGHSHPHADSGQTRHDHSHRTLEEIARLIDRSA